MAGLVDKPLHELQQGSGSGLDADTLDGRHFEDVYKLFSDLRVMLSAVEQRLAALEYREQHGRG